MFLAAMFVVPSGNPGWISPGSPRRGDPGLIQPGFPEGTTNMAAKNITVTLSKSLAGRLNSLRGSVRGLGLRRPHQTVQVADTPQNRGMIYAAKHMLKVEPPAEGGK